MTPSYNGMLKAESYDASQFSAAFLTHGADRRRGASALFGVPFEDFEDHSEIFAGAQIHRLG